MTEVERNHYKALIDPLLMLVPDDEMKEAIEQCKNERALRNTGSHKDKMGMSHKGEHRIALKLPPSLVGYMEMSPQLRHFFNSGRSPEQIRKAKERLYFFANEYPQFTASHFSGRR